MLDQKIFDERASVYGLKDRRNNEIFYVGMSTDPYARYGQHVAIRTAKDAKGLRILDMRKDGLMPELVIIEQDIPIEQAPDHEEYWIHFYLERGKALTNIQHVRNKNIETIYNNYHFRSRIKARWAVFFDALGMKYQYEPKGYDLDGSWYLPDFFLPDQDCWIEIKGKKPSKEEQVLAVTLAKATEKNVYIFFDGIPSLDDMPDDCAEVFFPDGYMDFSHWWCECSQCHKVGIQFSGYSDRLCQCFEEDAGCRPNYDSPRIIRAYKAARQARFEHQ